MSKNIVVKLTTFDPAYNWFGMFDWNSITLVGIQDYKLDFLCRIKIKVDKNTFTQPQSSM